MNVRTLISIFTVSLSLLFTACGDDEGGGNGNKGKGRAATASGPIGALDIDVGNEHTCAILLTGKLACWGSNTNGALGTGSSQNNPIPIPIEVDLGEGQTAVTVAADRHYACAILEDGSLKCWGNNISGQLGVGDTNGRTSPTDVELGEGRSATNISAGTNHMCAVLDDSSLLCWGNGANGKLGDGDSDNHTRPVSVNLPDESVARMVSAGSNHTCALLTDGQVLCWGSNASGQLGDGTGVDNVAPVEVNLGDGRTARSIDAGSLHTCAVLDNGSLVCWGENDSGELGIGNTSDSNTPESVNLGNNRTALGRGHRAQAHLCPAG